MKYVWKECCENFFGCIFLGTHTIQMVPKYIWMRHWLPPTNKLFSCYNPIKTSFLALAIAPVPFLFNFILFVQTGHANFDFN